ncbi:hypothetical protein L1887_60794 [Cichorium endivia]|nr:hypothetical protein L1887_60794 [Cichorium endivia]
MYTIPSTRSLSSLGDVHPSTSPGLSGLTCGTVTRYSPEYHAFHLAPCSMCSTAPSATLPPASISRSPGGLPVTTPPSASRCCCSSSASRSPHQAAVAVVHQHVAPERHRRVVVHTARAVRHIAHDHRGRAREALHNVRDPRRPQREPLGHLQRHACRRRLADVMDGLVHLEIVVRRAGSMRSPGSETHPPGSRQAQHSPCAVEMVPASVPFLPPTLPLAVNRFRGFSAFVCMLFALSLRWVWEPGWACEAARVQSLKSSCPPNLLSSALTHADSRTSHQHSNIPIVVLAVTAIVASAHDVMRLAWPHFASRSGRLAERHSLAVRLACCRVSQAWRAGRALCESRQMRAGSTDTHCAGKPLGQLGLAIRTQMPLGVDAEICWGQNKDLVEHDARGVEGAFGSSCESAQNELGHRSVFRIAARGPLPSARRPSSCPSHRGCRDRAGASALCQVYGKKLQIRLLPPSPPHFSLFRSALPHPEDKRSTSIIRSSYDVAFRSASRDSTLGWSSAYCTEAQR